MRKQNKCNIEYIKNILLITKIKYTNKFVAILYNSNLGITWIYNDQHIKSSTHVGT